MAYLALSTANLPSPVIDPAQGASPEDHFNTVIWTGDGTSGRSITTGHQPDFVWTKERNSAINHIAQNSISGTGLYLHPNTTAAEQSATTLITSFDSNGFTVGNSGSINGSSDTYVAWSWKANGSGSDSSSYMGGAGTGASATTSVNTTAGFSITKYYIGSSPDTYKAIPHLLGSVPDMIIVKNRDGAYDWAVNHVSLGANGYAVLNSTAASGSDLSYFRTGYFDSNTFTVGGSNQTGAASTNYIAYSFKSVEGFSKFGSYVGNGSSDGPFVYTGFRPAFVLGKNITNAGNHWFMVDQERTTFNGGANWIKADVSSAELTNLTNPDFLSNGFKIRSSDAIYNTSGSTFIYMAFAENPFKYSNAR